MSVNRENVVWLSPADGKWRNGHFRFYNIGNPSDPDWDHEWDVEYDHSEFWWVGQGAATAEAALRMWRGANPGGYEETDDPELGAEYDRMNAELRERQIAERRGR